MRRRVRVGVLWGVHEEGGLVEGIAGKRKGCSGRRGRRRTVRGRRRGNMVGGVVGSGGGGLRCVGWMHWRHVVGGSKLEQFLLRVVHSHSN